MFLEKPVFKNSSCAELLESHPASLGDILWGRDGIRGVCKTAPLTAIEPPALSRILLVYLYR